MPSVASMLQVHVSPVFISMQFATMARRALKLVSLVSGVGATAGLYMHSNKHLDPNDFGVVRIGRAVATVSFMLNTKHLGLKMMNHLKREIDF